MNVYDAFSGKGNMNQNIQILDCTLRDGGLGLEDAVKSRLGNVQFDTRDVKLIASRLAEAEIDIIELGAIEQTPQNQERFCIYSDIESISRQIPANRKSAQFFAALYRGPDTPLSEIPVWNPSLCEVVRVIIRYSELQKSLNFCAGLAAKGYKVFVQPMLTSRYTRDELDLLIRESNKMKAYALYFVDSYGYMQAEDVENFFHIYDDNLNEDIRIGFHAHNNMNLAFSNALSLLNINTKRKIIIDSCLLGMGQGAGNLQTELILGYLNQRLNKKYPYVPILDGCEIVEKYGGTCLWGYSLTRLLPALHKTAYKYGIALRNQYHLSYGEIEMILSQVPEELRQRYTPEQTIELLNKAGFSHKQK